MAYRSVSVWLKDILKSIGRIEIYLQEVGSLSQFIANKKTIDATERNIEIIAEALKRSVQLDPDLPISEIKKIIGLRNVINHEYYGVEYDRLYVTLIKHLPVLNQK